MQCVIDHDDLALLVRAAMAFKSYVRMSSRTRTKRLPSLDALREFDEFDEFGPESANAQYEALETAIERGLAVLIA